MPNIQNIIFDVGQVLFAYNPQKIIDTLLPNTTHSQFYLEELFLAPIWQDMDRGIVDNAEVQQHLNEKAEHCTERKKELPQLLDNWVHHLDVIEENKVLLTTFSKTHNTYILSNFQDQPFDVLEANHDFFSLTKGKVVSGKIKMMKPEKKIYHYLLDTFNLDPNTSLFIDDLPANIAACKEVGMHGIVFENHAQLKKDLKAYNL